MPMGRVGTHTQATHSRLTYLSLSRPSLPFRDLQSFKRERKKKGKVYLIKNGLLNPFTPRPQCGEIIATLTFKSVDEILWCIKLNMLKSRFLTCFSDSA